MNALATSPLRLFTGQSQAPPDSPQLWTIRQAFEEQSLPLLKRQGRSKGTVDKWRKAVWYWEQCRPDDPPICEITRSDLDCFPELILDEVKHFAIRTHAAANQQQMYVNAVLGTCDEILDKIPKGRALPVEAPSRHRRIIKDEVITDLYFEARTATLCKDHRLPAPLVWQSLLVLLCSIGCRRTEAATMPVEALVRSVEFPDIAGIEIDAESPHGWLVFHTPKTKARKHGLPLVLPVSRCLRSHLDELDRLAPNRRRMFPIGNHGSGWRKQFRKIHAVSGIAEPYTFQDFRKTANRRFRRASDRETAAFMLGHQPRGVNATFYDDLTGDAVAMLDKVNWPRGFDSLAG